MNTLKYIVEPTALWLTWRPVDLSVLDRLRRTVGLIHLDAAGLPVFHYLRGTEDFEAAKDAGFQGFQSFDLRSQDAFRVGVLESFLRRLPPRTREDFAEYLSRHRLPHPFPGSSLALLGYTGAALPSDGFELVPVFPEDQAPLDFLTELAGVRHVCKHDVNSLRVGDSVVFDGDPANTVDQDAVIVRWQGHPIGFVNRTMRKQFQRWLRDGRVHGTVDRLNGTEARPRVFVRIEIR
jgi:hypothetical protein